MSSVVISNRSIFNQKVGNIEQNKVLLPFNVNKEQEKKLVELLAKIKVTFLVDQDKLSIKSLSYQGMNIKATDKELNNSKFTLAKTYVVTMKQNFMSKVETFYKRIESSKLPTRPTFNISNETNLQEALAEATAEIDLKAINSSLNAQNIENNNEQTVDMNIIETPTPQVLANDPLGETVIDNPVNLNEPKPVEAVVPQQTVVEPQTTPQPEVQQPVVTQQEPMMQQPVQEVAQKPKVRRRLFSRKGNVLVIPIVAIWLGAVFYGTMKLVLGILT